MICGEKYLGMKETSRREKKKKKKKKKEEKRRKRRKKKREKKKECEKSFTFLCLGKERKGLLFERDGKKERMLCECCLL